MVIHASVVVGKAQMDGSRILILSLFLPHLSFWKERAGIAAMHHAVRVKECQDIKLAADATKAANALNPAQTLMLAALPQTVRTIHHNVMKIVLHTILVQQIVPSHQIHV